MFRFMVDLDCWYQSISNAVLLCDWVFDYVTKQNVAMKYVILVQAGHG